MQLIDYTIHGHGDNKIIHLETPELIILEEYLNSYMLDMPSLLEFLDALYGLRDNWDEIEDYADNNYNGFWDEEILFLAGETGNLFTFYCFKDLEFVVNVDTIYIYMMIFKKNFQDQSYL